MVELILVNMELLMSNTVNSNTQSLVREYATLDLDMYYQMMAGDNYGHIKEVIKTALGRSDIIVLIGGPGPTGDDLAKEVCTDVMGIELVEDLHTKKHLEVFFEHDIYKEIPGNNQRMTTVPSDVLVLDNDNDMVPGLILEKDDKAAVLLPEPPGELYPMFEQQVFPWLSECQQSVLVSRVVKICGCGESQMGERILDLTDSQTNPIITTCAKTTEIHLCTTVRGAMGEEAGRLIGPVLEEVKDRFKGKIYTTDEYVNLETVVAELLKKHRLTISTAEPCIGRMMAAKLVSVPGVSQIFMQGTVIYLNEARMRPLGVKGNVLRAYGAISGGTAKEMASGGAAAGGTDVCATITGLIGPERGTNRKPVGLVYMACYVQGNVAVREHHFKGNRDRIRKQPMMKALDLIRLCILDHEASR